MKKEDLKIVFLGTPEFAVESLDRLVCGRYNVVAVVTMPDKPAGRGHKMYSSPVKVYAQAHDIPVLQPVKLKDPTFVDTLRAFDADLFIVIAFRMLPEVVWSMPPMGTFNLHASLLPRYRGAAPINRAVMNGDKETGVTTFMLKHEIDTGDILRQESIDIAPDEDAGSVHDRLMRLGADLTIDTVDKIIAGTLRPIPQEQLIGDYEPTPAPKIFAEDLIIDWNKPASEVHNQIRGLSPYPAARSILYDSDKQDMTKILRVKPLERHFDAVDPGKVITSEPGKLIVACAGGDAVEVISLCPAGKKIMTASDFLRGRMLTDDARFGGIE
ncbi:MAG: methionyl-tRNA formyltransferase [Odoribacter sp.]|nr:methionyl-tRNA formyltransferase [Odoribacter sp.]